MMIHLLILRIETDRRRQMLKRKAKRGDSKQPNTTRHRGAYISKRKSSDGIANMSAFYYSNRQQLIINRQLKTNHPYFIGGSTRKCLLLLYWKYVPFVLLDCP